MRTFFDWYFDLSGSAVEEMVHCPFPHKTANGMEYLESHPSAHVNTEEGLFHCKACGRGYTVTNFIKELLLVKKTTSALKLANSFRNSESLADWEAEPNMGQPVYKADELGISPEVQRELKLITRTGSDILYPVFMYNKLLDIRTYAANQSPKVRSRPGCMNGLVIPFNEWQATPRNRVTILCAGEKDMAIARTMGFNAITITGGEGIKPAYLEPFRGRDVVVAYDNDDAGKRGAERVCNELAEVAGRVRNMTAFHAGMENKEDVWDFFMKYHKTREDFIQCIEATPDWEPTNTPQARDTVTLLQASQPNYINRICTANIQVVAMTDSTFVVPEEMIARKFRISDDLTGNSMRLDETLEWVLEDENIQDILHLMDNNFKEQDIRANAKTHLLRVPYKERNVTVTQYGKATVYKAVVTDMFESSSDTDTMPMEYTAYSIGHRLESGTKYQVEFKLVPHPYKGQQLTMLILNARQADDSVSNFQVTPSVQESLRQVQALASAHTVSEAIHIMTEKVKGLLGYNGNNLLIETLDLAYHTPLQFNLGKFKNQRAYLDTLVVGESRVGKSSTAEALRIAYGLGCFTSLAGNSATVSGLIGGSAKVGGSYQTKAGLIPQNHKGLMILEEFGKCNSDMVAELTDIRSSNEVRITRVSGTLRLPAMVRMISLSNVKYGREVKPIASYPHGLAVITELVGSAEDIARYDIMLVLSDRGNTRIDPFWEPLEPLEPQVYKDRIRWVWSRSPNQIHISPEVGNYLVEKANALNQHYDSHIKVFGTEAWKKLARVAIAVAGYLVSTDETFENIVVTREHIDHAYDYFVRIYDNSTFRLKEYVQHERQFSQIDEAGVQALQQLYIEATGALLHLEQEYRTNKAMLTAAAGLNNEQMTRVLNRLMQGMFVRLTANSIIPTERFRLGMNRINRNVVIRRLSDLNANVDGNHTN